MDVMSAAVPSSDGTIQTVDVIEYAGHLWLVPVWIDQTGGELTMPGRLVCLSLLPHIKAPASGHDYAVTSGLPKEIFDYEAMQPKESGLLILDPLRLQMLKHRRGH